jgi:hypothetical protein
MKFSVKKAKTRTASAHLMNAGNRAFDSGAPNAGLRTLRCRLWMSPAASRQETRPKQNQGVMYRLPRQVRGRKVGGKLNDAQRIYTTDIRNYRYAVKPLGLKATAILPL